MLLAHPEYITPYEPNDEIPSIRRMLISGLLKAPYELSGIRLQRLTLTVKEIIGATLNRNGFMLSFGFITSFFASFTPSAIG